MRNDAVCIMLVFNYMNIYVRFLDVDDVVLKHLQGFAFPISWYVYFTMDYARSVAPLLREFNWHYPTGM